jgi:hypothetical protein
MGVSIAYTYISLNTLDRILTDQPSCDPRTRAYKNGKTFDQCRTEARSLVEKLVNETKPGQEITWKQILEMANHDEIVYKLILKYFRQKGYDIGNHLTPRVIKAN